MQGAISTMDVAILDKFFQVWEKEPVMYNDFCSAIGGLLERLLTWLMRLPCRSFSFVRGRIRVARTVS